MMETVGSYTKRTDLYQVLLQAKKNLPYSHIQCSAFAVEKIISPTRTHDLSDIMQEAYLDYVSSCQKKGETPVNHNQWPSGKHGGPVNVLLGINSISFTVIHSFHGLIFIKHNIDSLQAVSVGGQLNSTHSGA